MSNESTPPPSATEAGEDLRAALAELIGAESRLVLAERAGLLRRSVGAIALVAVGGVLLLVGVGAVAWAVGALLATVMAPWGAALIVGALLLGLGGVALAVVTRRHRDDAIVRLLGPEASAAARELRAQAVTDRERAEVRVQNAGIAVGEALLASAAERGVQAAVAVISDGAGEVIEAAGDEVEELVDDVTEGIQDFLGIDDDDAEDGEEDTGADGAGERRDTRSVEDDDASPGLPTRVITAPIRLVVAVLQGGLQRSRRLRDR